MKVTIFLCAIVLAFVALSCGTRCDISCPAIFKPVCGQLGRNKNIRCTFSSECILRARSCNARQNWIIVNIGKCKKDNAQCKRLRG